VTNRTKRSRSPKRTDTYKRQRNQYDDTDSNSPVRRDSAPSRYTTRRTPLEDSPPRRNNRPPDRGAPAVRGRNLQRTFTNYRAAPRQVETRKPRPGQDARTDRAHIEWVKQAYDHDELFDLRIALEREDPQRRDLLDEVERQLIKVEIRKTMGYDISTTANIYVAGGLHKTTARRAVSDDIAPDDRSNARDDKVRELWNRSLTDSEVDTIRDIKKWANEVGLEEIKGEEVRIQLIGNTGPCDSCKLRLRYMTEDVMNIWRDRGIEDKDLPDLKLWSYYANSPDQGQRRGGYTIYNGWPEDPRVGPDWQIPSAKTGQICYVRQHEIL
jgi:hypothetical protein